MFIVNIFITFDDRIMNYSNVTKDHTNLIDQMK